MACKAGDRVELIQSASGSGVGMVASGPKGESAVPSMILSIVKVADDAYAQLSSTETQMGGPTGKLLDAEPDRRRKEMSKTTRGPSRSGRTAFTS